MQTKVKYPTIKALSNAVKHVKGLIDDDCRIDEMDDSDIPGICLTVGFDEKTGSWACQTGDNSYTGNAYGYPHWAVVGVRRRSNSREVAKEILDQLSDLVCQTV